MNAIEVLRMAAARSNAIRRYAMEFDRLAEAEQIARLEGDAKAEFEAHDAAVIAYVAWQNEMNDVKPKGLP